MSVVCWCYSMSPLFPNQSWSAAQAQHVHIMQSERAAATKSGVGSEVTEWLRLAACCVLHVWWECVVQDVRMVSQRWDKINAVKREKKVLS